MSRLKPSRMSTYPFTILSRHTISPVNDGTKLQNWIIQTDSYTLNEAILNLWCEEVGASYQIASEWGFYYPQCAKLFLVTFTAQAKAALERRT